MKPPKDKPYCRTPSLVPRDGREKVAPSISKTTSKPFERTSYNEIQWSPQDDIEDPRRNWTGPVKIAILDTGIDLDHPNFSHRGKTRSKVTAKQLSEKMQRERIIGSKNFTRGHEDDVTDDVGHGTHIAVLIMAIAPRAELYIAKALNWAMENEVDIVNMSLRFAEESS
ncbi:uncharacterized protein FTOL_04634 [Fusarium torulosum]|uniref:Peptidase S8/S53 domain-containing protein n=1 Tax=Fusarium torulosum TaxID=33205 RepID=A0AAE8M7D7_9HYPO|nr:uncharacterized protein FTOL_04634 [Fusarium torulosum]